MCQLFPVEEKRIYGILTIKMDLRFTPSLEKARAGSSVWFVKILGINCSLPDNNTSSHTSTLTKLSELDFGKTKQNETRTLVVIVSLFLLHTFPVQEFQKMSLASTSCPSRVT